MSDMFFRDFTTFVAHAFAHLYPEICGIDELHFTSSLLLFAVGEHPDISGDACVVEKLLGQGYNGLKPIVLQYPAANLALTTASVACEERRAVHHDCYAAPAFFGVLHASEHVLEKEQLAVTDARGASAKATGGTPVSSGLYSSL